MDFEAILAQWLPLLKKYWLPIALCFCGLIFFAYGLTALLGSFSKPQDLSFRSGTTENSTSSAKLQNTIQVDIEGAVAAPGVYKLAANSIIKDVLVSSRGLSADADRAWVEKNLNLAAKLYDGTKVYIPKIGETAQITSSDGQNSIGSQTLININTASSDSLDSLPGVGPATVARIVNGRPYSNINELLDKKAVSSKVFDEIKDKISVY
ncbi:MAG TPA: ComEA family DNA-binding protein [Patescibacteria group bacterium]|nr:ComEA family DNA-binding protein [Patescibacteria group bacterium]